MSPSTRRLVLLAAGVVFVLLAAVLLWPRHGVVAHLDGRTAPSGLADDPAYRRLEAADRAYGQALDRAEDDYAALPADASTADRRRAEARRMAAVTAAGRAHDAASEAYARDRRGR